MLKLNPIHRILLTRLAIVTVFIALAASFSVYHLIGNEINKWVVSDTIEDFRIYKKHILNQLDSPGVDNHWEIQRDLETIPLYAKHLETGKFVILRLIDKESRVIAGTADREYPNIAAIKRYSEKPLNIQLLPDKGTWHETSHIDGRMVIRIAFPIINSAGEAAAYGETFFAVSDDTMEDTRKTVIRATAAAVGIVMLTAIVLYPIIIQLINRLEALSRKLLDANMTVLKVLGSAVAKRDSDTDLHNYRVTIYAVRLAEAIGLDDASIRVLIKGAFLHDVGKIGVQDAILHKPGQLNTEEYEDMKRHVSYGLDIIGNSQWLADAADVVGGHHERFDGSGYDQAVSGMDIPVIARIFSIADVFDALTSKRPYKEPFGFEQTMAILEKGRGKDFDPELLDRFKSIARSLHDEYVAGADRVPQDDVSEIGKRYFTSDIAGQI